MVQISEEIAQVNQMELRSGKKLPPVPNFGKNLVQELSQSKNISSQILKVPPRIMVYRKIKPLGASLRGAPSRAKTKLPRPRMPAGQTLAANGQHVRYDILAHLKNE